MVLGRAGPSVEAISSAKTAAYGVFQTIKNPSRINPISDEGKILETVSGRIQIKKVTFAYPSRPDVEVCNNYSLIIEAGETVALVGPSGSGKSTIVSFLERFYDPLSGSVMLDGEDLRCLNVKWLRQQIGLVGQEPVLFHTTILENIRYGSPSATDEQVFDAARMANAYDFIATFPQGFATEVGPRGAQSSGGQKQRIAIARAVVRNPRVLILDEATSALDTEAELAVLDSLKHLQTRSKCTIILIAHNLSTIRDADRIAVHSHAAVVETDTHNELMNLPDGQYRTLVDEYLRGVDGGEMIAFTLDTEKQHNETKIAGSTRQNQNISDDDEVLGDEGPPISNSRIWKLSLPDWTFMAIGAVGAIVNAAVFPVWGLMFTKLTMLFYAYSKTKHEMLQDARYWALGFIGLGIVFGLSVTLQNFGFAVASQRLIARVRCLAFGRMLRQEIAWFDKPHNAPGALVARLATDSATLLVMTSEALNNGLVNVSTLGIALGISFFHSWQMTLVVLAVCPILVLAFYIQSQQMSGAAANKKNNEADAAAGSLLQEAVGSSRTVASLGMEEDLVARYSRSLEVSNNLDARIGIVGGLTFGFSLGMTFLFFAFLFYVAGKWVNNGTVSFESAFVVLMVIMLSMFAVGMTAQNATTAAVAKASAQRIFSIIDRVPAIDAVSPRGLTPSEVAGEIVFNRLQFSYPSRSQVEVYRNFSLTISGGQTVALAGPSGSGKSTAIALLERFYDASSGLITLDGTDLRLLNVQWLRDRIALVHQEPVLFSGSIADNIGLAKVGATRDEVIEAAKKSNAFDFVSNFPDGFDTEVGEGGTQISGGQKQRIAIARAILRDADVLLLDEATSALDAESERLVQDSLDRLLELKHRTTIIVAHRLSTIRRADLIAVVGDGGVVEIGTHEELMRTSGHESRGAYRALVARQMQYA